MSKVKVEQTEQEMRDELMQFVNYHDGGYIEGYVACKLVDYMKSRFNATFKEENKDGN